MTLSAVAAGIKVAQTLVSTRLHDQPDRLNVMATRARYCQMLAGRCKIPSTRTARLVLAAWLSLFDNTKDLTAKIREQFHLDDILFPPDNEPESPEVMILRIVRCFQDLALADPHIVDNPHRLRPEMETRCAPFPPRHDVLHRFLRLLAHEKFLVDFGHGAGRILIVHPQEPTDGLLSTPLRNEGYRVQAVRDSAEADQVLKENIPDLLLVSMGLPILEGAMVNGVEFCQRIKDSSKTAQLPIIMLAHKGTANVKTCLRAGADDCLPEPPDLELLSHKIRHLIAPRLKDKQAAMPGLSGNLTDMHITDMMQIFSAGGQSMKIELEQADAKAVVFIEKGEIVHVQSGSLQGEQAFYSLMRWNAGAFTASHCDTFPPRTIHTSVMSLLMEGARLADEASS